MTAETTQVHSRLLKCALEVDESRAYWRHAVPGQPAEAQQAFDEYWFGAKSLARAKVLLTNFRERFDAFPDAHRVLHGWRDMDPDTRRVICHWHVQLTDPLYRAFTGDFLVARRAQPSATVTRDAVVRWLDGHVPTRWTAGTRIQAASKLLSAALSAGLVAGKRDPRPLALPRVGDATLTYGVYLLRGVTFDGTLLDNPYFRSVGLRGADLEDRLRGLSALSFRRQGDLLDFGWRYPSLAAWATPEAAP